jgi:hypothetical protein
MRVATTIIQSAPGSQEWATALAASTNPQDHRDFIKSLPPGDQVALVLESGGRGKRRKVTWAKGAARKTARKK